MRTRRCPCTSTLIVPSGMRSIRPTEASVPISYRFSGSISCVFGDPLGDDEEGLVLGDGLFHGPHGGLATDEERAHHVGEKHGIADRQQGIFGKGERFFKADQALFGHSGDSKALRQDAAYYTIFARPAQANGR